MLPEKWYFKNSLFLIHVLSWNIYFRFLRRNNKLKINNFLTNIWRDNWRFSIWCRKRTRLLCTVGLSKKQQSLFGINWMIWICSGAVAEASCFPPRHHSSPSLVFWYEIFVIGRFGHELATFPTTSSHCFSVGSFQSSFCLYGFIGIFIIILCN